MHPKDLRQNSLQVNACISPSFRRQTINPVGRKITSPVNEPSVSNDDQNVDLLGAPAVSAPTPVSSPAWAASRSPPAAATAACTATAAATAAVAASAAASADPRLAAALTAATVSDMEIFEPDDGLLSSVVIETPPALVDTVPGPLWSDVAGGCSIGIPLDEVSLGSSVCFVAAV